MLNVIPIKLRSVRAISFPIWFVDYVVSTNLERQQRWYVYTFTLWITTLIYVYLYILQQSKYWHY